MTRMFRAYNRARLFSRDNVKLWETCCRALYNKRFPFSKSPWETVEMIRYVSGHTRFVLLLSMKYQQTIFLGWGQAVTRLYMLTPRLYFLNSRSQPPAAMGLPLSAATPARYRKAHPSKGYRRTAVWTVIERYKTYWIRAGVLYEYPPYLYGMYLEHNIILGHIIQGFFFYSYNLIIVGGNHGSG